MRCSTGVTAYRASVEALRDQLPARLVGELDGQGVADLFRAPAHVHALLHEGAQHRVSLEPACPGPAAPAGRQPVRRGRPVPAIGHAVAGQLPADRRGAAPHLLGDSPAARPSAVQVGDRDPLVLEEVPGADGRAAGAEHRRIVQCSAADTGDAAPVPPPGPGLAVDPHLAAGSAVAHPRRNQADEQLTLLDQRLDSLDVLSPPSRNPRSCSGAATIAGIRPDTPGPTYLDRAIGRLAELLTTRNDIDVAAAWPVKLDIVTGLGMRRPPATARCTTRRPRRPGRQGHRRRCPSAGPRVEVRSPDRPGVFAGPGLGVAQQVI